jgi:predicted phosphoribosyltransferase
MRFRDRQQAGERLAGRVESRLDALVLDRSGLQVLALPRGGVPVGRPIADRLTTRLRLLLVRKLGLPGHPELAMGAIAAIGDRVRTVCNQQVVRHYGVDQHSWQRVLRDETREIERRMIEFGKWTADEPGGAPVVLVDDGLATGATMLAAVDALRSGDGGSAPIVVAVPVASNGAVNELTARGVEVVCLSRPDPLLAVGEAYRDFHQLDDAEVITLLAGPDPGPPDR